ncbi:phenylacetate--CoA ligase family protein [Granulosicoccus sp. 3-233]|uniref:phenylacetate--CoA ligase family protein n=1 Tax=Granulosicoccus sp. 3-233 TaxID=3417969 RepID=UPI003D347EE2
MFDELDTLSANEREQRLFSGFGARLEAAANACPGLARHLEGHSLLDVNDRAALQQLPVLRKQALMQAQQQSPPFGDFVDMKALEGQRVFMSPGPVWEPQLPGGDPWQSARALHAAGIRRGHRLHNAFSYHLTPGGFILDEGARALGCIVFPAGVGGTDSQVQAMRQFAAQAYIGTPDYLQTLLDHAASEQLELPSLKHALVSGGALFPAMRDRYAEQGIQVQQCYATADLGVIAYETGNDGVVHPGMVINENLIVDIVVPGTSTPVEDGEVGEVVVTRLSPIYPLLRFATGDLSALLPGASPCGRTAMRLRGWMGRADQRVKIRGMFVDPQQLQTLPELHPEVARWRLSVIREQDRDVMTLAVTLKDPLPQTENRDKPDTQSLADTLKRLTNLSGSVTIVESLPDDGLVVEDKRDYEQ